jgi:PAS domain-containing protein
VLGVSPNDETLLLYDDLCAGRAASGALRTPSDYTFVLELHAYCIVVTDLASHIVGWNKAAEAQFGFTKDFIYGGTPTLIYAPARDQSLADNPLRIACIHPVVEPGQASLEGRPGMLPDPHGAPLYDRSGALIGGFGTGVPET